ncbi:hypothetical protein D2V05_17195 [Flagellimonas pelagia]|uniref:Uncharacterized protein n=1 Tax=Flagellimonas pelagia TaxID=2306998 RepID=A0A3A1NEG7_9FLAO|nr:hypothetical protein D2V05_17195 [Allomuricauda maritima]
MDKMCGQPLKIPWTTDFQLSSSLSIKPNTINALQECLLDSKQQETWIFYGQAILRVFTMS